MLDRTYQPAAMEARRYALWERSGAFAADPDSHKPPYAIMMPPPNVTGSLHMGHALTFTLQDVLARYHRMRGRDVLWQPGTDHAGIATEIVVGNQVVERPGRFIVVAPTRPETMLGDTGVAVHPDDPRFADLVGKSVRLPLTNRLVPVVADEHADPETGTGAVKITPAHDFADFEVGRRHGLALINIFDPDARLTYAVPAAYRGLDRFSAREKVVADLASAGLLDRVEEHTLMVPHHDRSGVVIEPWLTDQWYCDARLLAAPALAAVNV